MQGETDTPSAGSTNRSHCKVGLVQCNTRSPFSFMNNTCTRFSDTCTALDYQTLPFPPATKLRCADRPSTCYKLTMRTCGKTRITLISRLMHFVKRARTFSFLYTVASHKAYLHYFSRALLLVIVICITFLDMLPLIFFSLNTDNSGELL